LQPRSDDLRRLSRAGEVARVDRGHAVVGQLVAQRGGLSTAEIVQRLVGVPLKPSRRVPVGLAVTDEEKRGHATSLSEQGLRAPSLGFAAVDLGLRDSVCLITGSTGGIGLEVARTLAAEGARVATTGRRETAPGVGEALHVAADLGRPGEPERLVREVAEALGRVDVLVNNVGFALQHSFDEVTDEQWQELWDINVMSYVRAIRAVLPAMRERRGGTIVNVSSTAGKRPSASMPDYSVTKAAVLSLSRLIADVYAKDGVRCNAETPGPTATPAWLGDGGLADAQAERTGKSKEEVLAAVGAGRPLGRLAEPEEIAAVVAFLCSPRTSYVTGAAWSADGGTVPIII